MKKKEIFFVIIALFLIHLKAFTQSNYQKIYNIAEYNGGNSIQLTNDGGYIIAGYWQPFGSVPASIYLIKINSYGDTLWTKAIEDDGGSEAYSIIQTNDGGYALAGEAAQRFFVMKMDSNGDSVWTKCYSNVSASSAREIQQTYDGGYIIVGEKPTSVAGIVDIYLVKTDANGDTLWTRTFGGGIGKSVRQTTDSGYIFTGNTGRWGKVFLIKTDMNGDTLWTKAYNEGKEDGGNAVRLTTDSGFILTGYTTSSIGWGGRNVYLIKTDLNGDTLWTKAYDGGINYDDEATDIQVSTDGGYIVGGFTTLRNGRRFYMIKTNAFGDTLWTRAFGGTNDEWCNSVKETMDGGFILTGSTFSFGIVYTSIYLIKTDSLGNSGCNQINIPSNVKNTLTIISHPNFVVSKGGIISGNPLIPFTMYSGCKVNTLCTTVDIDDIENEKYFTIYPNPSNGCFILELNHLFKEGKIMVFDIMGKKLLEESILINTTNKINLKNATAGIYFVKILEGYKERIQKIIIM